MKMGMGLVSDGGTVPLAHMGERCGWLLCVLLSDSADGRWVVVAVHELDGVGMGVVGDQEHCSQVWSRWVRLTSLLCVAGVLLVLQGGERGWLQW